MNRGTTTGLPEDRSDPLRASMRDLIETQVGIDSGEAELGLDPDFEPGCDLDDSRASEGGREGGREGEETIDSGLAGVVSERRLVSGDRIGRYVLLERVGAGAIGIVYAAYDPQLDRRVAVKVLRSRQLRGVRAGAHQARLQREAQALARVSHENVVAVHEVDRFEGRIYIAMEFVAGLTLRLWLEATPRSRAEILAVFEQAGRGLAAAHAAGLIHRDFKPDNVVVTDDGRVKVLDFGLARPTQVGSTGADDPSTGSGAGHEGDFDGLSEIVGLERSSQLTAELTQVGGIVGTPAYMAPEQQLGLAVTARCDQFAFCVALYEALYGERPFAGESVAAVALAIHEGMIRPAPSGSDVPSGLRRVITRGLAAEPEQRYPDLPSLLADLRRDPKTRANRWFALALAAVVVGAAGLAWGLRSSEPAPVAGVSVCSQGAAQIEEVWGPGQRDALRERFGATALPFADHSARRVTGLLDAWSTAWAEGRDEACAATTVRQEQSEALMDQRMSCLDRLRRETAAHVDRLLVADAETIERAVEATAELGWPSECADTDRLLAIRITPTSEQAAEITRLDEALAEIAVDARLHSQGDALARAQDLLPAATKLDDPATSIRLAAILAGLHANAGEHEGEVAALERGYVAADRLGDDQVRITFGTGLVRSVGYHQANFEGADLWIALTEAAAQRVGDPPEARAKLDVAIGTVLTKRGEYDRAVATLREAVAQLERLEPLERGHSDRNIARQALAVALRAKGKLDEAGELLEAYYRDVLDELGPDHPAVAIALSSLANNAYARTDYVKAVELHERSLAILRAAFGSDSSRYHDRLNNYAVALAAVGRTEEAEATHREILKWGEQHYGVDDVRITPSLENLGNVLTAENRFEEARDLYERSLAIKQAHYGVDHPSTAMSSLNLGVALYQLGDYDRAEALYRETERVWTAKLGADHADLGIVMCNLGDVMHARGREREAVKFQLAALALFEPAYGSDSEDLAWPLTGLGLAQLALGEHQQARAALDRAASLRVGVELPKGERARMEFARARAVWEADPEAAIAIARAVEDDARELPNPQAAAFTAWLAKHS